jgi:hypothetical protein
VFEEQIGAGIMELEQRVPDFRNMLVLETLDMNSPARCVLGQIARHLRFERPDYYGILRRWRKDDDWSDAYGFSISLDVCYSADSELTSGELYHVLTKEWRRALTA